MAIFVAGYYCHLRAPPGGLPHPQFFAEDGGVGRSGSGRPITCIGCVRRESHRFRGRGFVDTGRLGAVRPWLLRALWRFLSPQV